MSIHGEACWRPCNSNAYYASGVESWWREARTEPFSSDPVPPATHSFPVEHPRLFQLRCLLRCRTRSPSKDFPHKNGSVVIFAAIGVFAFGCRSILGSSRVKLVVGSKRVVAWGITRRAGCDRHRVGEGRDVVPVCLIRVRHWYKVVKARVRRE